MSKTIKQIAEEVGVSKQAVQKRLSRQPLSSLILPYIFKNNGTNYIDSIGENLIRLAFDKGNLSIDKDNLSIDKDNLSIDKDNLSTDKDNLSIDKDNLSTDKDNLSIDKDNLSTDKDKYLIHNINSLSDTLQSTIHTLQSQLNSKDKLIMQLQLDLTEERRHSRDLSNKLIQLTDQSQQLQLAQLSISSSTHLDDSCQIKKKHWWQHFKR